MAQLITDDLDNLLGVMPPYIQKVLQQQADLSQLLEVVMDIGRLPEARFLNRELVLSERETSVDDIEYITSRISSFGGDNRAGIERTLHRISAIRNRKGIVIGLSCRVGRAVYGTIKIIEDLVQSGKNVLLLGRPGVGKTTMLRELARVLADDMKKRVVIVDTSNEIAGDGDIPHPAIGHARRMQVPTPEKQHAVMIEAVENHMPEVIIIDEIGSELEAIAARTIAERGVQLVGTAHGNTLENLMANPTLSDLIGGIQAVTLGDEEAKRRGTQKTILERKAPPTFDIVVEIQDRNRLAICSDIASAVDSRLRGQLENTEIRWLDDVGTIQTKQEGAQAVNGRGKPRVTQKELPSLFLFGINRNRLEQVAQDMKLKLRLVEEISQAELFVTSKNYYRRKPQKVRDAESSDVPIYVLKNHTPAQFRQFLYTIHPSSREDATRSDSLKAAIGEAEQAIDSLLKNGETIELTPQSAYIRRLQHLIAERNSLSSSSTGQEPNRCVRIFK